MQEQEARSFKVIITGSTGMVGKGVLFECLENPAISEVLAVNRSSLALEHPKLSELILSDFKQLSIVENQLIGYDACFYCMGVSVLGLNEEKYTSVTYSLVKTFADTLFKLNSALVFNYVSGIGTDSSETGKVMWARVKGKTENYILNKGFLDAYMFRPGIILPQRGVKSKTSWYNALYFITRPIFPLLKMLKSVTTSSKIGKAMINTLIFRMDKKHLENHDINELAGKSKSYN